jgi:hypothetical protein
LFELMLDSVPGRTCWTRWSDFLNIWSD